MDKNGAGVISRKEWAVHEGDNAVFDQIAGGIGSALSPHACRIPPRYRHESTLRWMLGMVFDRASEANPPYATQKASAHMRRPLAQMGARDDSCHGFFHAVTEKKQNSVRKQKSMAKRLRASRLSVLARE